VPLDVPLTVKSTYEENFRNMTFDTGRLMLFAGDQKAEHLNDDFYGPHIHPDDADPRHLFQIASRARIGVFATQMGLVAQYGEDYPNIPYIIKLNARTNLHPAERHGPVSLAWYTVPEVVAFKKQSGLLIHGVGYTLYPGSESEHLMLQEAAQVIRQAHEHGLVTVLWVYPQGSKIRNENDPHLIAGACGLAATLGSDFVKINAPAMEGKSSAELLREAVLAAGRTRVVCAGGPGRDPAAYLHELFEQIHTGGTSGNATGRNIHQKPLREAIRMCNAISAITFDNADVKTATAIWEAKKT
jgi:fructose-bisphosphate aldolase/6-deoxy-5-ketofructose 1-phosphate synthase